ncbi:MAG: pilus assembly protein [Clostridiales bacterium]|nr:pilus assembly protein [Clostridiales bacterium]MCF8023050.1 pilus assembly protein [Clostridiales bacterium]
MFQLINTLRKSRRGQALVELALVIPILILILFGIMEFGRVFHSYLVITHAAREGARNGVISKDINEIKQKAQNASPGLNLDINNDIAINPSTPTTGDPLTVTINHEVELYTPVLENILTDPVPLSTSCTMRVE